ncbi:WD40/YVTN/BNR-like repeat-containing protein [Vacuolonema iberomarrocanum]|uniref:WD40/YVTN/BNR-like repeat-containing protein n=1 Tax=Vacuolonema iberomarrocanum TaxID=3454632 RepID=UPI001A0D8C73|nr:exo-alpha-sialidase [filamentous cyanobacterium LEGE 07170]
MSRLDDRLEENRQAALTRRAAQSQRLPIYTWGGFSSNGNPEVSVNNGLLQEYGHYASNGTPQGGEPVGLFVGIGGPIVVGRDHLLTTEERRGRGEFLRGAIIIDELPVGDPNAPVPPTGGSAFRRGEWPAAPGGGFGGSAPGYLNEDEFPSDGSTPTEPPDNPYDGTNADGADGNLLITGETAVPGGGRIRSQLFFSPNTRYQRDRADFGVGHPGQNLINLYALNNDGDFSSFSSQQGQSFIYFFVEDTEYLYTTDGNTIRRSNDGGSTWQNTPSQPSTVNGDTVIAGTDSVLMATATTQNQTTFQEDAVISYSTDRGATWQESIISLPDGDGDVRPTAMIPGFQYNWALLDDFQAVYISSDNGLTWASNPPPLGFDFMVDATWSGQDLFVLGGDNIYRLAGGTWSAIALPSSNWLVSVGIVAGGTEILAYDNGDHGYRSVDNGLNWAEVTV